MTSSNRESQRASVSTRRARPGAVNDTMAARVWTLMIQAYRLMWNQRKKDFDKLGISGEMAGVLLAIETSSGPITPSEIARQLVRTPQAVAQILTRMENKGLIRRIKDFEQKNKIRLEATEKADELFLQMGDRQGMVEFLSVLSQDECRQLMTLLKSLRRKGISLVTG